MEIKICPEPFDPFQEIKNFQNKISGMAGKYGATNIFIGTMRDLNDEEDIQSMTLEHYPGMTEKQLEKFVIESKQNWQIIDALIVHRVGAILPDQPIVLVAVWSSHRGDAFDACRSIMEALKAKAPFWKKEILSSSEARWVEKNTDGYLQKN